MIETESAVAWHYDAIVEEYMGLDQATDQILSRLTDIRPGSSVLDVGCATGNLTFRLAQLGVSLQVLGIDISQSCIEKATEFADKQGLRGYEFRQGSAMGIPCADESFDLAVSNLVYHLIPDKRKAMAELVRILKPSGRAVLKFMGGGEVLPEWEDLIGDAWRKVLPDSPPPNLFYGVEVSDLEHCLGDLGITHFEIIHRRRMHKIDAAGKDHFLNYLKLVGGFWRWKLQAETVQEVERLIAEAVEQKTAAGGHLPVTLNSLIVDFTK